MNRIALVGWLISLAVAFHLGWWARWRMNQKLKKQAIEEMEKARAGGASEFMARSVQATYWEAL